MTDGRLTGRGWLTAAGTSWLLPMLACPSSREPNPADPPMPPASSSPSPPRRSSGLTLVADEVSAYAEDHTVAESAGMRAIAEQTRQQTEWSVMMIGPLQG